jgi:hypothetical protein
MRYPPTESPVVRMLFVTIPGAVPTRYGLCELDGPVSVPGAADAVPAPRKVADAARATNDPRTPGAVFFIDASSPCVRLPGPIGP